MYKKLVVYGIYLFVFLVPLFPDKLKISIVPVSVDFLIIAYLAAVIFLSLFLKDEREKLLCHIKKFCSSKFFIAVAVYSFVCLLSMIPAVSKTAVIAELFRFWTYIFLLFVIISYVDDVKEVKGIILLLLVSVSISGVIGLYQFFSGVKKFIDTTIGGEGRVYSTFVNPNYWGAFVNLMIFPVMMLAIKKVKHYWAFYLMTLLLLVNLIISYTRGSWVGFGIGLLLFVAIFSWKLIIPVILISPAALLIQNIRKRFFSIFDVKSWSIVERFRLWKTGLSMFKDHPILGVGNGNYLLRYNEYIKKHPELNIGKQSFSVHNSYIKVLCETGILGFIPYLFVNVFYAGQLLSIYRKSENNLSKYMAAAYICSISSYLFQNFTNNMFFIPQVNAFYWIIGGIIIAYSSISDKNEIKMEEI